jgi:flavorubredoxin
MVSEIMKAESEKIGEGVYWVGVLDWDIRKYHGYTLNGTTYNAYLVFGDDKVALIDNTYPGNYQELMARVEDAFGKEGKEVKIDVIVQNHVEKDHSGVLPELHKKFPDAPIYCTKIAVKGLLKHFPPLEGANFVEVGTGDALELGGKTLAFLDAFLLHWLIACSPYWWRKAYYSPTMPSDSTCATPSDTTMKYRNIC